MKAGYKKHTLKFKFQAGTSRGILTEKDTYYLILNKDGITGIGECSTIPGLSIDHHNGYENKLKQVCEQLNEGLDFTQINLLEFPSIAFGMETAILDLGNNGERILFPGEFVEGKKKIPINGLIWMGDIAFMKKQITEKLKQGFHCLKLKIGAIDFNEELELIKEIRKEYTPNDLELRVDANGAFAAYDALERMEQLAQFHIHSIEQPIAAGQFDQMYTLCMESPLPIALDEELIGDYSAGDKMMMLQKVMPAYIVIKPSMVGGIGSSLEWISAAERLNIGWWVTSALESNIGLNAIAQWLSTVKTDKVQGLGTGSLYTNNIPSPLFIENQYLKYNPNKNWDVHAIV